MESRSYRGVEDGDRTWVRASWLASSVLLLLAAAVLWLAVPRFLAGVNSAPHGPVLEKLGSHTPPDDSALARARAGKMQALDWHLNPHDNADLGALHLYRAEAALARGDRDAARALFVASIDRHRVALRQAPLQPYVWTQLAQADIRLDAPKSITISHLRQAVTTAPWEPALVVPRLGLAFAVWPQLDDDMRQLMETQIRHAARMFPSALAHQARRAFALDTVLGVLAGDADLLRRFSDAYSRL